MIEFWSGAGRGVRAKSALVGTCIPIQIPLKQDTSRIRPADPLR
ncbi:hypothetical protein ILFOPFJJ_03204 [Ensifer psoraleae]|nr:hypothetical protein [Sinorhizobium psoraleae]